MRFTIAILAALATAVAATPSVHTRIGTHQLSADGLRAFPAAGAKITRAGWESLGAPAGTHELTLYISLVDNGRAEIERIAREVSNPDSPSYGKYLTRDEVSRIVKSDPEHASAVLRWLRDGGVPEGKARVTGYGDLIRAEIPVSVVEKLLDVTLLTFRAIEKPSVKLIRSTGPYSVPVDIARHIVLIDDVHKLPNIGILPEEEKKVGDAGNWPAYCGPASADLITPPVLRQRYNITRNATTGKSSAIVAEFQGQDIQPSDLSKFQAACGLKDKPVDKFVGPTPGVGPAGVESSLDVDMIAGVAPNVGLQYFNDQQYSIYTFAEYMATADAPPAVSSISYGNDEEQNSKDEMTKIDAEFARCAARGLGIFIASGDQGVWGRTGEFSFHPSFPASSKWVSSVGATQFPGASIAHEVGTSWSGGGFSTIFAPESYQASPIKGYFASGVKQPSSRLFNAGGRGIPDISANGGGNQRIAVMVNGGIEPVAGTSASCPIVAAMFALLNDVRYAASKPALGFVNPLLYKIAANATLYAELFDDITSGKNSAGHLLNEGFEAAKGWDPITGVGNPNFEKFAEYVAQM